MTVEIPPELAGFVQSIISAGSFNSEAEVIGEALRLLQKRVQLRQDVQAGVEQLDRGEYSEYDEHSRDRFVEDIKAEERERFPKRPGQK